MSARVTIVSSSPAARVTALLGPAGAVLSGGYGGWNEVARPRRVALTIWGGHSPQKMTMELIFDDFIDGGSVEPQCEAIEKMAKSPAPAKQPPIVTVSGSALPAQGQFLIADVKWGDFLRRGDGKRVRQLVTLELSRYVKDTKLREQKASARARAKVKK